MSPGLYHTSFGVSEQSDCVVVVVSEETGEIRIAHDGNFGRPMLEEGEVKAQLSRYLSVGPKESGSRLSFLSRGSSKSA